MDLTSRQRAYLKSIAGQMDPVVQIGKSSLTPTVSQAVDQALEKRELIKVSVLRNCLDDPCKLADMVAGRTHAAVVQVIGKKFILYRPSKKNPKIELPD
ncbi:MAG: ribosome assembly RNA-binding protein YhbY [Eubacterium sp.]|nr:ribosome assembly RNA-binding protein YhbY [Eubacterium sp.]